MLHSRLLVTLSFFFCLNQGVRAADAVVADPLAKLPEIGKESWKDAPIKGSEGEVLWADGAGPFVMLGRNTGPNDSRTLWSLAERKSVGKIPGKFEVEAPFALAPSGKYLACGRGFIKGDLIAIFDAMKGKPLAELKNPERFNRLEFIAGDKLAIYSDRSMTLWDVAGKKIVGTFKATKEAVFGTKFFVSHNGKLIGQAHGETVRIFDAQGKELANYARPKAKELGSRIDDVSLNQDGKTLAVLIGGFRNSEVLLLDITTGDFRGPISLAEGIPVTDKTPRRLAWSLDGEALLAMRKYVIDPKLGSILWQFPDEKNPLLQRGLLNAQSGLYWTELGGALTATAVEYEDTQIAEMRKGSVPLASKVEDPNRLKLTETNLSGAKAVASAAAAYTAKPGAVPPVGTLGASPISLSVKEAMVGRVLFARAAHLAFVEILDADKPFISMPNTPPVKAKGVEVFRLESGQRAQAVAINFAGRALAVSPDGAQLAVLDAEKSDRIDVLTVDKGTATVAFKPFGELVDKKVKFAHFVGAGQLLTGNGEKVVVWKLPEATPDVQLNFASRTAAISPSGRWLALADADGIKLFDSLTLKPLGALVLPASKELSKIEPAAIAFRDDEKSVAAYYKATKGAITPGGMIATWDLDTGKSTGAGFVNRIGVLLKSDKAGTLEFAGPDTFLVDGTSLISVSKQEVIWSFTESHWQRLGDPIASYAGRHWVIASADTTKSVLVAADVASSKIFDWVKAIDTAMTVLWKPGLPVKVSVQIPFGSDDAKKALSGTLGLQGFAVKDDAPNTLTITASETPTGKTQNFKEIGAPPIRPNIPGRPGAAPAPPAGVTVVNIVQTTGKAQLLVGGKVIWESQSVTTNTGHAIETLAPGESITDHLNKKMQRGTQGWASGAVPPRVIVQTPEGNLSLPGHGSFTAKGLEIQSPVVAVKP